MEGTGRSTVKLLLFLTLLGGIHSQGGAAEENQVINEREEANEPERQTYDRLQPASLADNRDYTELTVSTVSSGFQSQDARQTYERLQPDLMADNRDYTALSVSDASRGQRSQDNMYYNAALESDQSAGPSYTNVEGATSTNANITIKDCGSGTITFSEDTQPTLECTGMNSSQNISWSVNVTDNKEDIIGDCYVNNTCSAVTNNDYELTRTSHDLRAAADQSLPNNRDGEDFVEMHVNDVYGLGDTTNDDPNQVEASTKPMAAACRVPPTSTVTEPGKPAMVQHVFVTSNGGTPYMNVQQHAGVTGDDDQYAVIAEEHTEGPKGDVYAVVHKTHKKQEAPERDVPSQVASEQTVSPREGSGQGETNVSSPSGDVYEHADKSSKGANADHNSEKETDEKMNREQPNVDPKTSKPITKLRTTMETEPSLARDGTACTSDQDRPGMRAAGESYENVTMSYSELPSLATPDVTKTTDVDDEYNTLMLAGADSSRKR
ncbi:hypothetical protein BaRGS_00011621 [Batillaria attramentaria]|uniref:Uncharacterized protein n=1 Tax=Batillaria attramentaria TaxID=370345 RepID=A0ABD0LCL9_9CAEN